MEQLLIKGGKPLIGEVTISGAKNAALGILPAALLSKDICRIENVPCIDDIQVLLEGIKDLGVSVVFEDDRHTVIMDCRKVDKKIVDYEQIKKIRASYYLVGALLGTYKESEVALPGGCNIGSRPIDQHIKGFEALGATVDIGHGIIKAQAKSLKGATVYLDTPSVGASINIMMAAVMAEGITHIENAAKEPHIVDVANFLNSMGGNIKGAGTDIIKITGVKKMHGAEYTIIPDQIEAGTYMVAGAITGGDIKVNKLIPKHMEAIVAKLLEMGVGVEEFDEAIRIYKKENYKAIHVTTLPYPGFPTDMHPQFSVLMGLIKGEKASSMTENIFENRFTYIGDMNRMGAAINLNGNTAIIEGVTDYSGAEVTAPDLRAGMALVLAGLAAKGETIVHHVDYIDRGYEHFVKKLQNMGGRIYRINQEEEELKAL